MFNKLNLIRYSLKKLSVDEFFCFFRRSYEIICFDRVKRLDEKNLKLVLSFKNYYLWLRSKLSRPIKKVNLTPCAFLVLRKWNKWKFILFLWSLIILLTISCFQFSLSVKVYFKNFVTLVTITWNRFAQSINIVQFKCSHMVINWCM